MRVFSTFTEPVETISNENVKAEKPEKTKINTIKKGKLSDQEIRDRVEIHNQKKPQKTVKKDNFSSEMKDFTPDNEKEFIGDIKRNDPEDDNTREKLKVALSMHTFKFSDKERSALSQILK